MNRLLLLTNCLMICLVMTSCNPKNKRLPKENTMEETSNKDQEPARAIEHNAPDQAKIDSIKAAKLEERKKLENN